MMMGGRSLRNEDTEIGRRIWKAIDEAADRVPQWLQEELERADAATGPTSDDHGPSETPGTDS